MEKEIITLADQEINERIENHEHFLKHIEKLVDREKISSILNQVELKRDSVAGRNAYSAEVMFRIMLIQSWSPLSDYQMEDQLIFNMMFLWFSHLSMDNPKDTILCYKLREKPTFQSSEFLHKLSEFMLSKWNSGLRKCRSPKSVVISEFTIPPEEHQVYINLRELRTSELSLTEVHFAKWFCDK